jgi:SPOR domain
MADRYQDRPFPADDGYDRGDDTHASGKAESDPLAELARLIGQNDPFAGMGRANLPVQSHSGARDRYDEPALDDEVSAAGPPSWMQRVTRQETPLPPEEEYEQDYPSAVHPLQRYAASNAAPAQDYPDADAYSDQAHDPSRYDDALFGQLEADAPVAHDPAYADDPYDYQHGYADDVDDRAPKRQGGLMTVAALIALAVVGTGGAFAYRNYVGAPRSGEPPIIRADATPTKIVPAPSDAKVPDRLMPGDGAEKIVPREEAPVDVSKAGPRVVFPPLNQTGAPAPMATVGPVPAPAGGNGTLPNNEPRKIRTFAVRGDQPDGTGAPAAAKPLPAPKSGAKPGPSAANANASSGNAPLSLAPQASPTEAPASEPRTRVATTNPVPISPQAAPASGAGGGYLVQVSSQRNEADAQASYRALQGKFPGVLGSRSPMIKRADLGDKGVYYRAMVGPFGSTDEASQFCGNLKSAGGQCVVQRN